MSAAASLTSQPTKQPLTATPPPSGQSLGRAPSAPTSLSSFAQPSIVSNCATVNVRNDHNPLSSPSSSTSSTSSSSAANKYDRCPSIPPLDFTSISTHLTRLTVTATATQTRPRSRSTSTRPCRHHPQALSFDHNSTQRTHEYNLEHLLAQAPPQMQAAALLFMNRPGHRVATPSISHDSLSSDVVSHSSHDPLLSSHPSPSLASRPAVPPTDSPPLTLNTLDPAERAALIRQSRKLNKVLGATPHIAEANPRPLQRRGTISGPDTVHRSSSAVSASTSVSRGKVFKSLIVSLPDAGQIVTQKAPFLRIATNSSTPRQPVSPPRRRRLSDTSVSSSATGASFAFAPPSPVHGARPSRSSPSRSRPSQDSFQTPDSQRSPADPPISGSQASLMTIQSIDSSLSLSLASPVFSPRTTEELSSLQRQQTRVRMAKLQRLMGENVPSELVLPTAGRPSTGSRRPLSIDLPPIAKDVGRSERPKHKRTKSMWKKDGRDDAGFESAPEPEDQLWSRRGKKSSDGPYSWSSEDAAPTDVLRSPLTEKQKALNVKRAMKMAQVGC